jgi:lysosomal acid lipase/cholesteryl ester hydrolase
VALYWAEHDWLADPVDVQYLRKNLPNIVDDVYIADWNHLDFIWGTNAAERIYYKMIALMRKYAISNN